MTFRYLSETKTPHREVVIPFLDFPALNKQNKQTKKDKDFIHSKAYKRQLTSCIKKKSRPLPLPEPRSPALAFEPSSFQCSVAPSVCAMETVLTEEVS